MAAFIRGFLFFSLTFSAAVIIQPPLLLLARFNPFKDLPLKAIVWFYTLFFPVFGIKLQVSGREHIDPDKPYLVLANHQSFLDIPVILCGVRLLAFISKIEIKKWPVFGYGMTQMGCVFVDRKDPESKKKVGPSMKKKMEQGISFCVYPEGTRSPDGRPLPFKFGIFKIAHTAGMDILPVTIQGSWKLLRKNSMRLYPGTIGCVIHQPLNTDSFQSHDQFRKHVEEEITGALDQSSRSGGQ